MSDDGFSNGLTERICSGKRIPFIAPYPTRSERVCSGKSASQRPFLESERVCSGKKSFQWSFCPFIHPFLDEQTSKCGLLRLTWCSQALSESEWVWGGFRI